MLSRFSALFSSSAHVETYKDSRRLHKERGTQAFITVKNSPKSSNLNDDEPPGRIVKIFEETLSLQPEHTPLAEAAAGLGNAFGTSDVIKPLEAPAEPVTNKQKTDEDREIDAVASPQSDDPRARRNTSNSFLRRLSNGYFGLPRPSFGFRRSYKVAAVMNSCYIVLIASGWDRRGCGGRDAKGGGNPHHAFEVIEV